MPGIRLNRRKAPAPISDLAEEGARELSADEAAGVRGGETNLGPPPPKPNDFKVGDPAPGGCGCTQAEWNWSAGEIKGIQGQGPAPPIK
jgi:hypothetical protein